MTEKKKTVKKATAKTKKTVRKTSGARSTVKKTAKKTALRAKTRKKAAVKPAIKKTAVKSSIPAPEKLQWEEIYEMEIVTKARWWNRNRDVGTIAGINRRMAFGGYQDVIRDADRAYESAIWKIAGEILGRRDKIRLVIVAGPSSSGKTTTTLKLCEALRTMGEDLIILPMDNYFWNLKDQPQDEYGDHNFESPEALDIKTINQNLRDLLAGKEASIPIYDFKSGKRKAKREKMKLAEGQLLVIEGLHAFHGPMTVGIPAESQFRVYIETICQLQDKDYNFIPWTDLRLLRRMVRDNLHRNYSPMKTLGHWHYVRKSEKEYIVPFIGEAEAVVNGYLPYELPVYKKYLYEPLKEAVENYADQTGREDALRRALRCLSYLEEIDELEDDSVISSTSLIREFIGGSAYKY
jgi:uridine kinase